MPRRRYLSTEAGRDRRLSAVSERAAVCYLLSIPHADCCGRLPGDPFEYACEVAPGRHYGEEDAEQILSELVSCGLYLSYSVGAERILAFPARAFLIHQGRALTEGSRPEHPEPPPDVKGLLRAGYMLSEEYGRYGLVVTERGRTRKSAEVCGKKAESAEVCGLSSSLSSSLSFTSSSSF